MGIGITTQRRRARGKKIETKVARRSHPIHPRRRSCARAASSIHTTRRAIAAGKETCTEEVGNRFFHETNKIPPPSLPPSPVSGKREIPSSCFTVVEQDMLLS